MGLPLFGTVLSLTITATNTEIQLALGAVTFVHMTSTLDVNVIGLLSNGGNVDGAVVCLVNEGSNNIVFLQDSSLEATVANRFLNFSHSNKLTGPLASVWYRYNATTARWHHIAGAF
ncbi:MAG TPA: hypothetical protein VFQ42_22295 [Mycobacterium sp.]|nr:hypothetical protein [Mycobacterium sp.]